MSKKLVQIGLILALIIAVNVIANYVFTSFDITEDKRFTLTQHSKEKIAGLQDEIFVKVWLSGEFPAGFEELESKTEILLNELRRLNTRLSYEFSDPNEGSSERVKEIRAELIKDGMRPINLRIEEEGKTVDKIIYPYVQIYRGKEYITVNLLESDGLSVQNDQTINDAIALLEYRVVNGINSISNTKRPSVIFTKGQGEPEKVKIGDAIKALSQFYMVGSVDLDSIAYINENIDVLVVAKPRKPFSDKDKFKIDQFVMKGGRVLWLIDKLDVNIDSIARHQYYVPRDLETNLDDMLFSYGVRIMPNLVLDLESTRIPLQTGMVGDQPKFDLFNWYYHVAATPSNEHNIVRNLDRINLLFPSTIDTIKTKAEIRKTSLLKSSAYTRTQFNPVRLNFEILKSDPVKANFNQGEQNLAVLYEGEFESHFKDRVTTSLLEGLKKIDRPFEAKSVPNRMIVVSDGDVIVNEIDPQNNSYRPLGYNIFEQYLFDNKNFILNCIDYLIGDGAMVESRSKKFKLRLLDNEKIEKEARYWQLFNFILPLILSLLVGVIIHFLRKRRYAH